MTGECALPRLVFDRPEIIFPIVPLNIEAKQIFKIYNDGYENAMVRVNNNNNKE